MGWDPMGLGVPEGSCRMWGYGGPGRVRGLLEGLRESDELGTSGFGGSWGTLWGGETQQGLGNLIG